MQPDIPGVVALLRGSDSSQHGTSSAGFGHCGPGMLASRFSCWRWAYAGSRAEAPAQAASGRRSLGWRGAVRPVYFLLNDLTFALYRLWVSRRTTLGVHGGLLNVFFGRRPSFHESCRVTVGHRPRPRWRLRRVAPFFGNSRDTGRCPCSTRRRRRRNNCKRQWPRGRLSVASGPVYIHCMLGHGMQCVSCIAYLLSVGIVRNGWRGNTLRSGRCARVFACIRTCCNRLVRVRVAASTRNAGPGVSISDRFNFNPGVVRE